MTDPALHQNDLSSILVFCTAAVVAVPLARRVGLGSIIGYLIAGVVIGPSALGFIRDPQTVQGVAELGVVLLLFLVGLELKLSRLMELKRDILGMGFSQLVVTGALLAAGLAALGFSIMGATVSGAALALSATAVALQTLEERGDFKAGYGQRTFSVLLFQDLSIAPLLAVTPLLAGAGVSMVQEGFDWTHGMLSLAEVFGAVGALVVVGYYGLNPFFRVLAASSAREVMTAAALLVVLGAAFLMEAAGLSMAMGAFIAGLLLAESNFRHQLEADIEPFRGLLLGLFFMSVGMSLDIGLIWQSATVVIASTVALVAIKTVTGASLARLFGSSKPDALRIGALLAPAGEFAFVLAPLSGELGLVSPQQAQLVTAVSAATMVFGALAAKGLEMALQFRKKPEEEASPNMAEASGNEVLVIGFGRFGQVVNQILLTQGVDVTVIDRDVKSIRNAARFGFKVYYGDGSRLDVLRAAGVERARLVCVCIDGRETATRIVELVHTEFPKALTYARAYDRAHAIDLMNLDVDFQMRETFESAIRFGQAALEALGVEPDAALERTNDVRKRDVARLVMQRAEGIMAGTDLLVGAQPVPEPLVAPRAKSQALNLETKTLLKQE